MTYRNKRLTDLAHGLTCHAKFPHECNGYLGCVPAHSNWQIWGRGAGHKTPDWAFAAVCPNAHSMLDPKINPEFDREQRQTEWVRAFVSTQNEIWQKGLVKVA